MERYERYERCKRCEHCTGVGLVKKNTNDLRIKICNCINKEICYLCENAKRMGTYKECEICWGKGEIMQINRIDQKKNHNK